MKEPHFGEARRLAISALSSLLDAYEGMEKAVLGHDLFGLLRVIVWLRDGADEAHVRAEVSRALAPCGRFWTGDIWTKTAATLHPDAIVYEAAWEEGIGVPGNDRLRIDDRTRTRTAWLPRFRTPVWGAAGGAPVIVFYSFKGGVGRTTALAAFAIQRARAGERVLVVDFDLDAPGASTLLPGDHGESALGVVDYLLEAPLGDVDVAAYIHRCKRGSLVGESGGEIMVMPAGKVDGDYLAKLSRLDVEVHGDEHPLSALLQDAKSKLAPNWILIDSRAGLSPAAGVLLDGIAHLHVLFGTNNAQGQIGLRQVIRHLGEERVARGLDPAPLVIVQAMVVDIVDVEKVAHAQFNAWLDEALRDHYPFEGGATALESPRHVIAIPYRPRLALFSSVDDVAADLATGAHQRLGERIDWLAKYVAVVDELRAVAAAGKTIWYQQLSNDIGLGLDMQITNERRRLGALLGLVSAAEHRAGRPMLSAVVVHKKGRLQPGTGFYECARAIGKLPSDAPEQPFFEEELRAVHRYWGQ